MFNWAKKLVAALPGRNTEEDLLTEADSGQEKNSVQSPKQTPEKKDEETHPQKKTPAFAKKLSQLKANIRDQTSSDRSCRSRSKSPGSRHQRKTDKDDLNRSVDAPPAPYTECTPHSHTKWYLRSNAGVSTENSSNSEGNANGDTTDSQSTPYYTPDSSRQNSEKSFNPESSSPVSSKQSLSNKLYGEVVKGLDKISNTKHKVFGKGAKESDKNEKLLERTGDDKEDTDKRNLGKDVKDKSSPRQLEIDSPLRNGANRGNERAGQGLEVGDSICSQCAPSSPATTNNKQSSIILHQPKATPSMHDQVKVGLVGDRTKHSNIKVSREAQPLQSDLGNTSSSAVPTQSLIDISNSSMNSLKFIDDQCSNSEEEISQLSLCRKKPIDHNDGSLISPGVVQIIAKETSSQTGAKINPNDKSRSLFSYVPEDNQNQSSQFPDLPGGVMQFPISSLYRPSVERIKSQQSGDLDGSKNITADTTLSKSNLTKNSEHICPNNPQKVEVKPSALTSCSSDKQQVPLISVPGSAIPSSSSNQTTSCSDASVTPLTSSSNIPNNSLLSSAPPQPPSSSASSSLNPESNVSVPLSSYANMSLQGMVESASSSKNLLADQKPVSPPSNPPVNVNHSSSPSESVSLKSAIQSSLNHIDALKHEIRASSTFSRVDSSKNIIQSSNILPSENALIDGAHSVSYPSPNKVSNTVDQPPRSSTSLGESPSDTAQVSPSDIQVNQSRHSSHASEPSNIGNQSAVPPSSPPQGDVLVLQQAPAPSITSVASDVVISSPTSEEKSPKHLLDSPPTSSSSCLLMDTLSSPSLPSSNRPDGQAQSSSPSQNNFQKELCSTQSSTTDMPKDIAQMLPVPSPDPSSKDESISPPAYINPTNDTQPITHLSAKQESPTSNHSSVIQSSSLPPSVNPLQPQNHSSVNPPQAQNQSPLNSPEDNLPTEVLSPPVSPVKQENVIATQTCSESSPYENTLHTSESLNQSESQKEPELSSITSNNSSEVSMSSSSCIQPSQMVSQCDIHMNGVHSVIVLSVNEEPSIVPQSSPVPLSVTKPENEVHSELLLGDVAVKPTALPPKTESPQIVVQSSLSPSTTGQEDGIHPLKLTNDTKIQPTFPFIEESPKEVFQPLSLGPPTTIPNEEASSSPEEAQSVSVPSLSESCQEIIQLLPASPTTASKDEIHPSALLVKSENHSLSPSSGSDSCLDMVHGAPVLPIITPGDKCHPLPELLSTSSVIVQSPPPSDIQPPISISNDASKNVNQAPPNLTQDDSKKDVVQPTPVPTSTPNNEAAPSLPTASSSNLPKDELQCPKPNNVVSSLPSSLPQPVPLLSPDVSPKDVEKSPLPEESKSNLAKKTVESLPPVPINVTSVGEIQPPSSENSFPITGDNIQSSPQSPLLNEQSAHTVEPAQLIPSNLQINIKQPHPSPTSSNNLPGNQISPSLPYSTQDAPSQIEVECIAPPDANQHISHDIVCGDNGNSSSSHPDHVQNESELTLPSSHGSLEPVQSNSPSDITLQSTSLPSDSPKETAAKPPPHSDLQETIQSATVVPSDSQLDSQPEITKEAECLSNIKVTQGKESPGECNLGNVSPLTFDKSVDDMLANDESSLSPSNLQNNEEIVHHVICTDKTELTSQSSNNIVVETEKDSLTGESKQGKASADSFDRGDSPVSLSCAKTDIENNGSLTHNANNDPNLLAESQKNQNTDNRHDTESSLGTLQNHEQHKPSLIHTDGKTMETLISPKENGHNETNVTNKPLDTRSSIKCSQKKLQGNKKEEFTHAGERIILPPSSLDSLPDTAIVVSPDDTCKFTKEPSHTGWKTATWDLHYAPVRTHGQKPVIINETPKKTNSVSSFNEYTVVALETKILPKASSLTPNHKRKSQPSTVSSVTSDPLKVTGRGTSCTPPPRPPKPAKYSPVTNGSPRGSSFPSREPSADHHTPRKPPRKSYTAPETPKQTSLNPFDSDYEEDSEPVPAVRQKAKPIKEVSLNPFDSDYEDEVEDRIPQKAIHQNSSDIKRQLPPAGYNPFEDDDEEEEAKETVHELNQSSVFRHKSPVHSPAANRNISDSMSLGHTHPVNMISKNPFDEDEDEENSSCNTGPFSREISNQGSQSHASQGSQAYSNQGSQSLRCYSPFETDGSSFNSVRLPSSRKKRRAPLPPGFKPPESTLPLSSSPQRSLMFPFGGSSTSLNFDNFWRRDSSSMGSTLSLFSGRKKKPPPRPPPPKISYQ